MDDYLAKPFDRDDLQRLLESGVARVPLRTRLDGLQLLRRFQAGCFFLPLPVRWLPLEIDMRPVAMVVALTALAFVAPASSQDSKVYAALNANNEGNLQVRWGATAAEAKQRAAEACREVSKTCSNDRHPPTSWTTCSSITAARRRPSPARPRRTSRASGRWRRPGR